MKRIDTDRMLFWDAATELKPFKAACCSAPTIPIDTGCSFKTGKITSLQYFRPRYLSYEAFKTSQPRTEILPHIQPAYGLRLLCYEAWANSDLWWIYQYKSIPFTR